MQNQLCETESSVSNEGDGKSWILAGVVALQRFG
jgi:hypothetical protein